MNIFIIHDHLKYIQFQTKEEMHKATLRFYLKYKHPKLKDKTMSIHEVETYFGAPIEKIQDASDCGGLHLEGDVLDSFLPYSRYSDLSTEEREFVEEVGCWSYPTFLIVGINDDALSHKHGLAHALYKFNANYREEVHSIIEGVRISALNQHFYTKYHPSFYIDEYQAHFVSHFHTLVESGVNIQHLEPLYENFNNSYHYYISELFSGVKS